MKYTLVGELPKHQYCFVDSKYTHREYDGFVPCVWFGLVSYPGRAWGATVMLESGAIYRNIPLHALSFIENNSEHSILAAQSWDCYSENFTVLEYNYLSGLACLAKLNDVQQVAGVYLFSVHPLNDGFSAYPAQAKEFCFIKLYDGRITVQPTNHVVFNESSFTEFEGFPNYLKPQKSVYSAETYGFLRRFVE